MTKQGKSFLPPVAKDIIIVAIGVAIIWLGLRVAFGTNNPFYVVSSGSMEPELEIFDVIIVQGNEPFSNVEKGDIIVFNRPAGHDRVIVHRVTEVIDQDPYTIRTKGDANPASIPGTDYPITEEEFIGKVTYVIPQVGYVTRILTPPINYVIIAVIIGIMIYKQYEKSRSTRKQSQERMDSEDQAGHVFPDFADKEYEQQSNVQDGQDIDVGGKDFLSESGSEHTKDNNPKEEDADSKETGSSSTAKQEKSESVVDQKDHNENNEDNFKKQPDKD